MSRVFVIGDIHGAYRALRQCLERSKFDFENDHLVCLGDVADGWPETREAVDELLRITHLTYILGNHDWWTLQWMRNGRVDRVWYDQGGKATVGSYANGVPPQHLSFFSEAVLYHELDDKLFVHAGIDPLMPVTEQDENVFLWDRGLATLALNRHLTGATGRLAPYEEIYIGHTPVASPEPIFSMGVWLMDTGAGWSGVLSMMDIHSKEMFTSDPVPQLYPGVEGRKKRND